MASSRPHPDNDRTRSSFQNRAMCPRADAPRVSSRRPAICHSKRGRVRRFVHEELIDEFNGIDAVPALGHDRKIKVIHFLSEDGIMIGPFGETDFEERFLRAAAW